MATRSGALASRLVARSSRLAALLSLAACSPDTSLLSGHASFAGNSSGAHDAGATDGGSTSGGASSAGGNSPAAGEPATMTSGGDGGDSPLSDGGAAGAPAPVPCVATGAEICN